MKTWWDNHPEEKINRRKTCVFTKPNIVEDGDNQRTLVLSLTGAQTRLLPAKSYYDVQLTDAENVTHTYVSGIIFVTKEVSQ